MHSGIGQPKRVERSLRVLFLHAGLMMLLLRGAAGIAQTIPSDREALENAAGAGMASYADLNGYPGPKHILEMQEKLKLTEDQLREIEAIFDAMSEEARAKGEAVIVREEELHGMFRSGRATEADALRIAADIGRLRGELRAVHLIAHIRAKSVLTPEQTAAYHRLRHGTALPKKGSK